MRRVFININSKFWMVPFSFFFLRIPLFPCYSFCLLGPPWSRKVSRPDFWPLRWPHLAFVSRPNYGQLGGPNSNSVGSYTVNFELADPPFWPSLSNNLNLMSQYFSTCEISVLSEESRFYRVRHRYCLWTCRRMWTWRDFGATRERWGPEAEFPPLAANLRAREIGDFRWRGQRHQLRMGHFLGHSASED